jgi:AraC-like DNA-binding protein
MIERLLAELDNIADQDARFDRLCLAIEESCSLYSVQRQSSSRQLAIRIRDFIDKHFQNPDLGLKMVSVETGITEAYLSRVFKENMGDNFAACAERIRIEEACRLLAGPSCSVVSVAEAVGYNSDHVFRRAFRRVTGMNPAEYRHGLGLE